MMIFHCTACDECISAAADETPALSIALHQAGSFCLVYDLTARRESGRINDAARFMIGPNASSRP